MSIPMPASVPTSSSLRFPSSVPAPGTLHQHPPTSSAASAASVAQSRQTVCEFFRSQTCYHLMPSSSKVVVLDVELRVKDAFYAVLEHRITSAPLWDSRKHDYVGMLTVTDFIRVLLHYEDQQISQSVVASKINELEMSTVRNWKTIIADRSGLHELISVEPECSLMDAAVLIRKQHINRLPIVSAREHAGHSVLYVLTLARVLRHLWFHYDHPRDPVFSQPIRVLGIGRFESPVTMSKDAPVLDALRLMIDKAISAIPIVDENGVVTDVYSRTDVIYMAQEREYDVLMPIHTALHRYQLMSNKKVGEVHMCSPDDTLAHVVFTLVDKQVHRLILVDDQKRINGIVSMSDIFDFFLAQDAALGASRIPVNVDNDMNSEIDTPPPIAQSGTRHEEMSIPSAVNDNEVFDMEIE